MKNIKLLFSFVTILGSLLFISITASGQSANVGKLTYFYDNAGNRVQRKMVVLQSRTGSEEDDSARIATKTDEELEKEFSETIDDFQLSVYPNPTHNEVYYSQPTGTEANLQLISIDGKILLNKTVTDSKTEIDMSNLTRGNYFVRVLIGEKTKEWVIVKQ